MSNEPLIARSTLDDLDFSDVTTGERLPPIHPGEVLREEYIVPLGLTAHAVAMALQVPAPRIHDIVRERRAITVDTALRLAKYFGTSPEFWTSLQTGYDMAVARATMRDTLERILARVTPENLPDEADIDWGPPVGSELR